MRQVLDTTNDTGNLESTAEDEISLQHQPMLLNAMQTAQLLGLSRSSVYELMNAGRLRSVRIGASRRVRHTDLVDFVKGLENVETF